MTCVSGCRSSAVSTSLGCRVSPGGGARRFCRVGAGGPGGSATGCVSREDPGEPDNDLGSRPPPQRPLPLPLPPSSPLPAFSVAAAAVSCSGDDGAEEAACRGCGEVRGGGGGGACVRGGAEPCELQLPIMFTV
eukprot:Rhum_TRINITY_DN14643_c20_g1::Rhum_TRINITY_DN14643_c20_g1_i1::g.107485::m.107485